MSIFIANWKANPENFKEVEGYAKEFKKAKFPKGSKVVICPPAFFLGGVKQLLPKTLLGVQNISEFSGGAQTGEVTAKMAKTAGASFVIIGHSERRALGESPEMISKKIGAALKAGLTPILCVGESERDIDGLFYNALQDDLHECLRQVPKTSIQKIIVAYEPKWAIGKDGKVISSEDLSEAVMFLLKVISDIGGVNVSKKVQVIYGGSVDNKNVGPLAQTGVKGFLVGRASLSVKKFLELIQKGSERS